MSPLEAARKIKERGCGETSDRWMGTSCYFCDAVLHSGGDIWPATGHTADCPWLAMPKIVAALQAAESVAATVDGSRFISTLGATVRAIHKLQDAMWDELDEAKG